MNLDQLKGNWKQLKGKIKSEFGDLTDDEVMEAEGEAERLAGIVQKKYGLTKEEAEDKVDAFAKKHS
ncbi:UNVERIFIED_CONTAM: hypothetical protein GTU68_041332 [Idotea baltica]|nr:hypothetical protein [Idotea baltica]